MSHHILIIFPTTVQFFDNNKNIDFNPFNVNIIDKERSNYKLKLYNIKKISKLECSNNNSAFFICKDFITY